MIGLPMAEFIANPRRAPRAPARCRAAVVSPQGHFDAETEDIGSMGCQVVSPKLVRKGDMLQLVVSNERVRERLRTTGRVAWVSPQAPWRVGIAFDEASQADAAQWFEALLGAFPGLGGFRRVPDRIRADQAVFLGPPPRYLVDFTRDEATVLRAIGSGARVDELRALLRDRWPAALRALFSLIARQIVTFQRGQAVHPDTWTPILHEIEASLAVESLKPTETPRPPPRAAPAPAPRPATPASAPLRAVATPQAVRPIVHRDVPSATGEAADLLDRAGRFAVRREEVFDRPGWAAPERDPQPGARGAGGAWREARQRPADAQAVYDRALQELEAANFNGAIALLRQALALAPGDPEIAARLGKLSFRGSGRH
jgi:hypothetical protein